MPRGGPDYGAPQYQVANANVDVSALVLAQKGVNSVDGKGRLWLIDTFSEGLGAWTPASDGNGTPPYASTSAPEISPVGVALPAGTSAGEGLSFFYRVLSMAGLTRAGVEFGLLYSANSPAYFIDVWHYDTDVAWHSALRVSWVLHSIDLLTGAGYVTLLNLSTAVPGNIWLPVKMVYDFDAGAHVRAVVGQRNFDISTYPLLADTPTANGELYVQLSCAGDTGSAKTGYCGHAIVTLDEP